MAPGRGEDPYACTESNAKYRKYVNAVEAALKAFEYTTEWADLISALGKLTKVFQQHAKFSDIPRPLTVAKRLSQCLHPALPSGVHLKALETYSQIFDIIGADALPKSIHIYSIGLFPLMGYAGIRVKSALLDLLEKYYVPLGVSLKPALVGFLTGALHGLEEGTEFFDRVNSLLTSVQNCVGDDYMMSCLWHCVASSPPVRLPALIYINSKYDRRKPVDDQLYIVGTSNDRMVSALCCAASDTSQLVQRHLLDFLVAAFPLDGGHLVREDLVRLARAALFVILRREMSLNRRLFTWLTGQQNAHSLGSSLSSSGGSSFDGRYFNGHALSVCKDALMSHLKQAAGTPDPMQNAIRVLRLYAYLLDRPEIALLILDKCLFDTMLFVASNDALYDLIKPSGRPVEPTAVCGEWSRRRRPLSVSVGKLRPGHGDAAAEQTPSEEASKALNALLGLCDTDFVWRHLAAQVVRYSLSFAHLSAHSDIRLSHLPRLCRTVLLKLQRVADGRMLDARPDQVAVVVDLVGDLLSEMLQAVVPMAADDNADSAVTGTSPVTSLTLNASLSETRIDTLGKETDVSNEGAITPDGDKSIAGDGQGQRLVESCKRHFCLVFESMGSWLAAQSSWPADRCGLLAALCSLARDFADFPLYCWPQAEMRVRRHSSDPVDSSGWVRSLRHLSLLDQQQAPFFVRAQSLDTLLYAVAMSQQIIEQHEAYAVRNASDAAASVVESADDSISSETAACKTSSVLLLKPFVCASELQDLDQSQFYSQAAEGMWQALAALGHPSATVVHPPAARLLCLLHARDPQRTSSEAECVILGHLTSPDEDQRAKAALCFIRLWTLARDFDADNSLPPGVHLKPFNRLIMALLAYACQPSDACAADCSDATTAMSSRCKSWILDDCLRHNDLPKLLQAVAASILHVGCARVSIQYVDLMGTAALADAEAGRAKLAALETRAGLPLYHVTRPAAAAAARSNAWYSACASASGAWPSGGRTRVSASPGELPWQRQLRNRLLAGQSLIEAASAPFAPPTVPQMPAAATLPSIAALLRQFIAAAGGAQPEPPVEVVVRQVMTQLLNAVCADGDNDPPTITDALRGDRLRAVMEARPRVRHPSMKDVKFTEKAHFTSAADSDDEAPPRRPDQTEEGANASLDDMVPIVEHDAALVHALQTAHDVTSVDCLSALDELQPHEIAEEALCSGAAADTLSAHSHTGSAGSQPGDSALFHALHAHFLLYCDAPQAVDCRRARCILSTGTADLHGSNWWRGSAARVADSMGTQLVAILGQEFWSPAACRLGESLQPNNDGAVAPKHRSYTFLELLLTAALYQVRSYYANSPTAAVDESALTECCESKISALRFIWCQSRTGSGTAPSSLLRQLRGLLLRSRTSRAGGNNESVCGRPLGAYIAEMLAQCKTQKCLLHFVMVCVYDEMAYAPVQTMGLGLSTDILRFNMGPPDAAGARAQRESYERTLLDALCAYMELECVLCAEGVSAGKKAHPPANVTPVGDLKLFRVMVLKALESRFDRHDMWLRAAVRLLPCLEKLLAPFALRVCEQLCRNLECAIDWSLNAPDLVPCMRSGGAAAAGRKLRLPKDLPSNYIPMVLEGLSSIVLYCVNESGGGLFSSPSTPSASTVVAGSSKSHSAPGTALGNNTSGAAIGLDIFSNLMRAVTLVDPANHHTISQLLGSTLGADRRTALAAYMSHAKSSLLGALPHFMSTLCRLWSAAGGGNASGELVRLTHAQVTRRLIVDLLGPLATQHPSTVVSALALVWLTRNDPDACAEADPCVARPVTHRQTDIVQLILGTNALPLERLISAVQSAIREPARAKDISEKDAFPIEVCLLELLHACIMASPVSSRKAAWPQLYSLITDTLAHAGNMSASAVFTLFIVFVDFIRTTEPLRSDTPAAGGSSSGNNSGATAEDRGTLKQMQDACGKLAEAANQIVGWQLEHTTWLKRSLQVKAELGASNINVNSPPTSLADTSNSPSISIGSRASAVLLHNNQLGSCESSGYETQLATNRSASSQDLRRAAEIKEGGVVTPSTLASTSTLNAVKDPNNNKRSEAAGRASTRALRLLAAHLMQCVDSVCRSDDKDKMLPVLYSIWNNAIAYLKTRSGKNAANYAAACRLLAGMSQHAFTKPVWKRHATELLTEPVFFRMDESSARQWLLIIDNMVSHDKTVFKEILSRLSAPQMPNLATLISSRESEHEARAAALRRLSFALLSSPFDQYQPSLPDIQERLTECLRLYSVPVVQAQVLLCFRVLLVRISPLHFVSLWPSLITELLQAFGQLEQDLASAADRAGDDSKYTKEGHWLQYYLCACKLLETLYEMPSSYLGQFQMYAWSFFAPVGSEGSRRSDDRFLPIVSRLNKLLQIKYGRLSVEQRDMASRDWSLAATKSITHLSQLRAFFLGLHSQHTKVNIGDNPSSGNGNVVHSKPTSAQIIMGNAYCGQLSEQFLSKMDDRLLLDFCDNWPF